MSAIDDRSAALRTCDAAAAQIWQNFHAADQARLLELWQRIPERHRPLMLAGMEHAAGMGTDADRELLESVAGDQAHPLSATAAEFLAMAEEEGPMAP